MSRSRRREGVFCNGSIVVVVLVVALLPLIVLAPNVSALGLTPGRITLFFEPNAEKILSLTIVNTEHKAMNVSVVAEGEMANRIILEETSLVFGASEEQKTLKYKIVFPSSPYELGPSGVKARLKVVEVNQNGSGTVNLNLAVEQQIFVITEISSIATTNITEEKPNITKIYVENYTNSNAKIEIEVFNPTNQTIKAYSTISVYDKSKILRSQFNSTTEEIGPENKRVMAAFWDTKGLELGNYSGKLVLYYNNKTEEQKLMIMLEKDKIEIKFVEFESSEELREVSKEPRGAAPQEAKFKFKLVDLLILILIVVLILLIVIYFYMKIKQNKLNS